MFDEESDDEFPPIPEYVAPPSSSSSCADPMLGLVGHHHLNLHPPRARFPDHHDHLPGPTEAPIYHQHSLQTDAQSQRLKELEADVEMLKRALQQKQQHQQHPWTDIPPRRPTPPPLLWDGGGGERKQEEEEEESMPQPVVPQPVRLSSATTSLASGTDALRHVTGSGHIGGSPSDQRRYRDDESRYDDAAQSIHVGSTSTERHPMKEGGLGRLDKCSRAKTEEEVEAEEEEVEVEARQWPPRESLGSSRGENRVAPYPSRTTPLSTSTSTVPSARDTSENSARERYAIFIPCSEMNDHDDENEDEVGHELKGTRTSKSGPRPRRGKHGGVNSSVSASASSPWSRPSSRSNAVGLDDAHDERERREAEAEMELRRLVPHLSAGFQCSYSDCMLITAAIRNGGCTSRHGGAVGGHSRGAGGGCELSLQDRLHMVEAEKKMLQQRLHKQMAECEQLKRDVLEQKEKVDAVRKEAKQSSTYVGQKRDEMRRQLLLEETRSEKLRVQNRKLEAELDQLKQRVRGSY